MALSIPGFGGKERGSKSPSRNKTLVDDQIVARYSALHKIRNLTLTALVLSAGGFALHQEIVGSMPTSNESIAGSVANFKDQGKLTLSGGIYTVLEVPQSPQGAENEKLVYENQEQQGLLLARTYDSKDGTWEITWVNKSNLEANSVAEKVGVVFVPLIDKYVNQDTGETTVIVSTPNYTINGIFVFVNAQGQFVNPNTLEVQSTPTWVTVNKIGIAGEPFAQMPQPINATNQEAQPTSPQTKNPQTSKWIA